MGNQRRLALICSLVLGALIALYAQATEAGSETVYLPCPLFREGNVWRFATKGPDFSSNQEIIVISKKDGVILEGAKETTVVERPNIAPQTATSILHLEYIGKTLFEVGFRHEAGGIVHETRTRRPLCGDLPLRTQNETTATGVGHNPQSSQEIITVKALGRERVTVPAGNFDSIAVQITTIPEAAGSNTAPAPTITSVIYAAEKVGTVRSLMNVETQFHSNSLGAVQAQKRTIIRELQSYKVE